MMVEKARVRYRPEQIELNNELLKVMHDTTVRMTGKGPRIPENADEWGTLHEAATHFTNNAKKLAYLLAKKHLTKSDLLKLLEGGHDAY